MFEISHYHYPINVLQKGDVSLKIAKKSLKQKVPSKQELSKDREYGQLISFRKCRTRKTVSHLELSAENDSKLSFERIRWKSRNGSCFEHFSIAFHNPPQLHNDCNISFLDAATKESVSFLDFCSVLPRLQHWADSLASLFNSYCRRVGRLYELRSLFFFLHHILHNLGVFCCHIISYES